MAENLRLAELMAALSLGTDLGVGQPLEQALRTCLIALGLAEQVGLDDAGLSEVYYVALLRFLGCTADAHEAARMAGGDEIAFRAAAAPVVGGAPREFASRVIPAIGRGHPAVRRARLVAGLLITGRERARRGIVAHCEAGEDLAGRLGLPAGVRASLRAAFEQWNGRGMPNGLAGAAIPLPARIVLLARDAEITGRVAGAEAVVGTVRRRRGAAYDPALAEEFLRRPADLLALAEVASPWDEVLAREPHTRAWVPEHRLDSVLTAFADYVDLKSPFTAGHSRGVATLAAQAAPGHAVELRRAGLVHDLGRVSVPNGIWDKPGPLTDGERERVRLHAYYTERIVARVDALRPVATLAGMHHERLDGSGYHRGSSRPEIPYPARMLAAADAYQAMTQPRPHRPARSRTEAAAQLESMARSGLLDAEAVRAVLDAVGHPLPSRASWPAGLTDREVEVLRLLCRGQTKKDIAAALCISAHPVDHHVRHIYEKAGVQTRAGITLYALAHDLIR